ncbi:MAG: uridine phosphorylase [Clostridiaceae bacterium]|nr:uridine phosphorylase [Clostridiaceae bacterium]
MNTLYHIGINTDLGAEYAILPGDPGRTKIIASYLNNPKFINSNREYTTYCGELNNKKVIVMSTGIGGPSTAIAVEELYMAGVRTFVRTGTCGGMQQNVQKGDVVIATAAVRMEGTSKEYVPIEYPAVADFKVTNALVNSAKHTNYKYHIGVVQSKDSFYGQHCPQRMPIGRQLENNWDAWIKAGCLASEMECAALFTVSGVLKASAGAVLSVVWNQQKDKTGNTQTVNAENAIEIAVDAVKSLIED